MNHIISFLIKTLFLVVFIKISGDFLLLTYCEKNRKIKYAEKASSEVDIG